jgi:hypothetical protein
LEKAIARYAATGQRPSVYVKTSPFVWFPQGLSHAISGFPKSSDELSVCMQNIFKYERYGYEMLDAIDYYTAKLIELNQHVRRFMDKVVKTFNYLSMPSVV